MPPESILRGLYRLLGMVADRPSGLRCVRDVQARLSMAWPMFLSADGSPADVAVRIEILEELSQTSLALTGQTFDAICMESSVSSVRSWLAQDAVLTSPAASADSDRVDLDGFIGWLDVLVASGAYADPAAVMRVEHLLHRLLPDVAPRDRGMLVQRVYDSGGLYSPDPRVSLVGAHLPRADLVGAVLVRGHFLGAMMRAARLSGADLSHATLRRTVLISARLDRARLFAANLTDAELAGATLTDADLVSADLSGANLVKATLKGADLSMANLAGANLLGCSLEGAQLSSATLRQCNLLWADISEAVLDGADLDGAVCNAHTCWPSGFEPAAAGVVLID